MDLNRILKLERSLPSASCTSAELLPPEDLLFDSPMGREVHLLRLVSMEERVCREDFGTGAMFFVPREHTILQVDERKKNGQSSSMKARLHKYFSFPICGSCFVCKLFGISVQFEILGYLQEFPLIS